MVEGARLESVFRGNSNVGSNPTLSAIRNRLTLKELANANVRLYLILYKPACNSN